MGPDSDDLATRCLAEIVDLHAAFEDWMGQVEPTVDFGRCRAALGPGFHIVEPDGRVRDRDSLLPGLEAARGARADPTDPFRIRIEEAEIRLVDGRFCLATYVERQRGGGRLSARRSTVLFRDRPGGPNGVEWLHVHETWINAGGEADGEGA